MAKRSQKSQGELIKTDDLPVPVAATTPSEEQKFINRQIPYQNFAGKNEELDGLVVGLVRSFANSYRARMSGPMKRWAVNWKVANGAVPWITNDDDIHLYESQKALTSKVARVEEQILQFDPPFEMESDQSETSRLEAKILSSWVHRQMENGEWSSLIQPLARCGEITNFLIVKVTHERLREMRVHRHEQLIDKQGKPWWRSERRLRTEIVRRRIRYDQVDPFCFFFDLEAKNIQEASFAGDESDPLLMRVQQDADLGIFSKSQVAKVLKHRESGEHKELIGHWTDSHRKSRSIALGADFVGDEAFGGGEVDGTIRVRQVEAYVLFDFGQGFDGVTDPLGNKLVGVHSMLVTIVDGICVRFMQNPHDSKLMPYGFAKVNDNGAGAVAPAVWDAVTQMNAHLDRFASNVMRWIDLLVSPICVTADPTSELPKSMLSAKPGGVYRNVGPWDFMKVPDITASVGQLLGMFRREMEETSGALRVFESPQGTATETERKVQEQQRSARASFRASSDLWEQVALITQRMAAQFSRGPEQFAAVGKSSAVLGQYITITPDLMLRDARFRMIGMKNLHVLGTRQQGIAQWATSWAPMLMNEPDINKRALMKLDFELRVGRAGADLIFGHPESPHESWPQDQENVVLLSGQSVEVHPLDDDLEHLKKTAALARRKDLPRYIRQLILNHEEAHMANYQRKQAEAAAAKQKAKREAELMATSGGQPGRDKPPSYGGMPAQKDQGITPGPDQNRTAPRSGRQQNMSQSQAMA